MSLFPPNLRLKEPQGKPASLMPLERLKKNLQKDFGAATTPGR